MCYSFKFELDTNYNLNVNFSSDKFQLFKLIYSLKYYLSVLARIGKAFFSTSFTSSDVMLLVNEISWLSFGFRFISRNFLELGMNTLREILL